MSLKHQTVSGIKWLVGSSFLQKAISVATTVVLARILMPSIFGLFSLAFVAIDALSLFKSMGFDTALIRQKYDVEKAANTAFFIIPLLGASLYIVLSLSAPTIGRFLNNNDVVGVVRALGVIFIISCLGRVPAALMEKNMQFRQVSKIEVSSAIIYSASAIIFALMGKGIWSLVIAYVIKTLFQNIMFWIFSRWHPRFEFDKKIALDMFHFGKFIFLGAAVYFLRMNLDNLLVGKILGVAALGFYAIAFNIANFMSDYFGTKVYRVTYPAYAKLQTDIHDLKAAYLKVFKHISLIILPFGITLCLLSREFILFVYGQKWVGAADTLAILAWAGIFNALPASAGGIFLACGKPKITFWITTLQVAIFFIFISPFAKLFGITGVALVVSISSFFAFIITIFWLKRILLLKLSQIYSSIKTPLLASVFMAVAITLFKHIFMRAGSTFIFHFNFIIASLMAVIIYILLLYKIERNLFREIKEITI